MGLDINVGVFIGKADCSDEEESRAEYQADFDKINSLLKQQGLPIHKEPTLKEGWWEGMRYSTIHYLRRVYAYGRAFPDRSPPPYSESQKSKTRDRKVLRQVESVSHHLVMHSDYDGYYVPVDFPEVIYDEDVQGGYVGSSQRLLAELVYVAPYLGIKLRGQVLRKAEESKLSQRYEDLAQQLQKLKDDTLESWAPLHELTAWHTLYQAARRSVRKRAVIKFY